MINRTQNVRDGAMHLAHRVAHPRKWFLAALFISIGGFLNGYVRSMATCMDADIDARRRFDTGSIGAITEMPMFKSGIATLTPILRGLTVSLLLLAGALPSLLAGLLADHFGHLEVVLAGAIFFTAGAALEAGAVNLAMLLVGRSLVGIGEGLYLGNMNV